MSVPLPLINGGAPKRSQHTWEARLRIVSARSSSPSPTWSAIIWYSRIVGLPVDRTSHDGTIYDVPMQGETCLALDTNKQPITNSSQPLCFFWTADIHTARGFLLANDVELRGEVQDIGSVSFLTFKDPDNNLLMVCQRNV